jgi:hypothetical protein
MQWVNAFSLVQGDILWIAESDDLSDLYFLEKLLPAFDDPEVKLAYCASNVIDADGEVLGNYTEMEYLTSISETRWKEPYCISADQEINEAFGVKNTILNISAVLFRRPQFDNEFIEVIQGMHIAGDTYLILNLMKGGKVHYDSTLLNYHRRHPTSIVGRVLSEGGDTQLRNFFEDIFIVEEFISNNFKLSPEFPDKVEAYLIELWNTLAPDRANEDLKEYFPLDELMDKLWANAQEYQL